MTKLKGYRVMLGKTQRDMAKELNISVQSYNNKETGKTAFNDKQRLAIKSMVAKIKPDITIDELFYQEKDNKKAYESDQTTEALNIQTKTQHTGRQAILCRVLEHL